MKHIRIITASLVIGASLIISSCKKEYDTPPARTVGESGKVTIGQLRAMYINQNIKFTDDLNVYGTITADEQSGNLYKNVYMEDATGAVNVRLTNSGGLYQGDSIRINLKNCILSKYNGMIQIDSVDVDKNVVKQKSGLNPQPTVTTINAINSSLQSKLIILNNVEFDGAEFGKTYADAITQQSANRVLKDCNGNSIIVRTSGYSNFAAQPVPTGSGSLIAVVGEFNGTMQLYLRNYTDANLTAPTCGSAGVSTLTQDFSGISNNADVAFSGWTNFASAGSRKWQGKVFNTDKYAQGSAFGSTDASNVMWLVTPAIINSATKNMSFISAKAFWTHNALEVLISTNYNGANPTTATWTTVTGATLAQQSDADNAWIGSGTVSLASYLPTNYVGNFHIAFKYSGAAPTQTGSYRIDNVVIQD